MICPIKSLKNGNIVCTSLSGASVNKVEMLNDVLRGTVSNVMKVYCACKKHPINISVDISLNWVTEKDEALRKNVTKNKKSQMQKLLNGLLN